MSYDGSDVCLRCTCFCFSFSHKLVTQDKCEIWSRVSHNIIVGNPEGRDHADNQHVDKIILNDIFRKTGIRLCSAFTWLMEWPGGGLL